MYLAGRVMGELPPWMPLKEKYPGNPDSQWYVIFTPWFLMAEYSKPLKVPRDQFRASLDQDEQELLDRFGDWVTLEQLQWRRETIATKCGGDVGGFRQQYPSTDEEAFGATGPPGAAARLPVRTLPALRGLRDERRERLPRAPVV